MTQRGRQLVWPQNTYLGNGDDCPHGWDMGLVRTIGSKPLEGGANLGTSLPLVHSQPSGLLYSEQTALASCFS